MGPIIILYHILQTLQRPDLPIQAFTFLIYAKINLSIFMANSKKPTRNLDINVRRRSHERARSSSTLSSADSQSKSPASSAIGAGAKYDDRLTAGSSKAKKKKRLTKKAKIIIAITVAVVCLIAIGLSVYFLKGRSKPNATRVQTTAKTTKSTPKPATAPSPLTGVEVDPAAAKQPVVAVVIENFYPDARPQSGLSDAGVVYEALAEGGITRYLALYQDHLPSDIGPVRSLRTYFIDWGLEHNAPVAHVGGNKDALDLIGPLGMKNLDQFYNGSYFRRVSSRYAPHNVYITGPQMAKLLSDRGYGGPPDFTPWPRKSDTKQPNLTASTITVNFSGVDYQAKFDYDPATNSYVRSIRNTADIDANNKTTIKPKNIIVMYMPTQYGATRIGESTVIMQTVGSGKALVFMDGVAVEATWKKADHKARTQYFDASGTEIKLNRGKTWVSVVPTGKEVSYK